MRKFLFVVPLFLILLSACAPVGALQGFVSLPDGVKIGITAVVLAAVSFLLAKLVALIPWLAFLQNYRESLAMGIAIALIEAIQNAVPDAYGAVAILALQLILAVLALLGVGESLRKQGILK